MALYRGVSPTRGALLTFAILSVAVLACGGTSAQAALVTYSFSGQITTGPTKALYGVNVGDYFSGTLTYDTQAKLLGVYDGVWIYPQLPPSNVLFEIDGQDFSLPAGQQLIIAVADNYGPGVDGVHLGYSIPIVPTSGGLNPPTISVVVKLFDTTQSVFSDASLPQLLSADDFDQKVFTFSVSGGLTSGGIFDGTVDSFTLVPEPSTASLTACTMPVLMGYTFLRRRSRFSRASR